MMASSQNQNPINPNPDLYTASFGGQAKAKRKVMEGNKSLEEYLALPVEEYSTNVLKAKSIKRIDNNLFEVELETVTILSYTVTPIVKVLVKIADGFLIFDAVSAQIKSSNKELEKYANKNEIKGFMRLDQKNLKDETFMVGQA